MSHRKQAIKELERNGFNLIRSNGHFVFKHPDGGTVIVPNHNRMNENTYRTILRQIAKGGVK